MATEKRNKIKRMRRKEQIPDAIILVPWNWGWKRSHTPCSLSKSKTSTVDFTPFKFLRVLENWISQCVKIQLFNDWRLQTQSEFWASRAVLVYTNKSPFWNDRSKGVWALPISPAAMYVINELWRGTQVQCSYFYPKEITGQWMVLLICLPLWDLHTTEELEPGTKHPDTFTYHQRSLKYI